MRCHHCPELREYCAEVARSKRKAYQDEDYWGKPVPGFGDSTARILIVGLAPAAHGANRTGRMFTGDRSGDFLYAGLHRAGLANQPEAVSGNDGLVLYDVYIAAALRCAPPGNKPTAGQMRACRSFLVDEIRELDPRVLLCLGGIALNAAWAALADLGKDLPRPRLAFRHAAELNLGDLTLLCCYHVSQQNTFTGRLTEPMLDEALTRAATLAR